MPGDPLAGGPTAAETDATGTQDGGRVVQPSRLVLAGDRRREPRPPGVPVPVVVRLHPGPPREPDRSLPASPSVRLRRDTAVVLLLFASALAVITSLPRGSTNGQVLDLVGTPVALPSASPLSGGAPGTAAPSGSATPGGSAATPLPGAVVVPPGATATPRAASTPGPVATRRPTPAPSSATPATSPSPSETSSSSAASPSPSPSPSPAASPSPSPVPSPSPAPSPSPSPAPSPSPSASA